MPPVSIRLACAAAVAGLTLALAAPASAESLATGSLALPAAPAAAFDGFAPAQPFGALEGFQGFDGLAGVEIGAAELADLAAEGAVPGVALLEDGAVDWAAQALPRTRAAERRAAARATMAGLDALFASTR